MVGEIKPLRRLPAGHHKPECKPHWSEAPWTDAEWLRALKAECWDYLSSWEQQFIDDVLKRNRWPLTQKKRKVLIKLKDRHGLAYA